MTESPAPRKALDRLVGVMGSFGLATTLLLFLALLTFLGTLEQVDHGLYEVQKKYFESIVLVHWFGSLPVPLPGAYLVMALLAVNLIVGGIIRIRKRWSTAGIIIAHIGILLLFAAGFVKHRYSFDGHMTLYEGWRKAEFESYYEWEICIAPAGVLPSVAKPLKELTIPGEQLLGLHGGRTRTFKSPELPFELVVTRFFRNCEVKPKGPMFEVAVPVVDGFYIEELPLDSEAERNFAGAYVEIRESGANNVRPAILWSAENGPLTVSAGGKDWAVSFGHRRWVLPYTIRLDEFVREVYPGTNDDKSFESHVTRFEGVSLPQTDKIYMNAPMRQGGYILFQASWGPAGAPPETPKFSTLAVVRNPSDQWPLYACIIIGVGLLIQMVGKLMGYLKVTRSRRA